MPKSRGQTSYQPHWQNEFDWVRPVPGNRHRAKCVICNNEITIDSMGRRAISSHAAGKKHISRATEAVKSGHLSVFFPSNKAASKSTHPNEAAATTTTASQPCCCSTDPQPSGSKHPLQSATEPIPTPPSQTTTLPETSTFHLLPTSSAVTKPTSARQVMNKFIFNEKCTTTEILWCLHAIKHHLSLRAAGEACSLFKLMFTDSEVAQKIQLSKSKIQYSIVHGLGPFFENELKKDISNCPHFVIGFDESLNKIAQKQQMDVNIRYWDKNTGKVHSRYLTSVFLEHATSGDLLNGLKIATKGLDLKKLLQISMDGPNVNFKMLTMLKKDLASKDPDGPQLVELGSCGLHTVHCAFKNAVHSTKWDVVEFLRSIYNLFKDVPSRRGDFGSLMDNPIFPIKFCPIRWLENASVAERGIKLLPTLEKYIKKVKDEKKVPKCKSYTIVEKCLKNKLLKAELTFFQLLAEEVAPFLKDFQSDAPLAPFLHSALYTLMKTILQRIVKPEVLEATKLEEIDLTKEENLLPSKVIDIGFATRQAIRSVENVLQKDMELFRLECRTCLKSFVLKLIQRSPIKYELTRSLSFLNPEVLKASGGEKELRSCIDIFLGKNLIGGSKAEAILRQFKSICAKPDTKIEIDSFNRHDCTLDVFWMNVLDKTPNESSKDLREFIQKLLILSHGQANVERGFSINKECLVVNQHEKSLIAQRHVIEAINSAGGVQEVKITKSCIQSFLNAHAKYKESLQEQKNIDSEKKRKAEEALDAKRKLKELQMKKKQLLESTDREIAALQEEMEQLKRKK